MQIAGAIPINSRGVEKKTMYTVYLQYKHTALPMGSMTTWHQVVKATFPLFWCFAVEYNKYRGGKLCSI